MILRHLIRKEYEVVLPFAGISSVEDKLLANLYLVVINGTTFCGILTCDDIVRSSHCLVLDCLRELPKIKSDSQVERVLEIMKNGGYIVLPVFERDEFIGVVTQDDITEYTLEYQKDLATEKIASIGVLAGAIAHDFNNLLMAILGNLELAKRSICNEVEVSERITFAEKATFRARGLTQQLLTFAKGGAPVTKPVGLREIVEEACSLALSSSKLKIEAHIPDDLWPIRADSGQISQVIHHLAINARQAMPERAAVCVGGENIIIHAGMLPPLKEGRYVRISIIDACVGILEKNEKRVVDPIFTTQKRESGLGSAIITSIVHGHEGHIDVKPKPEEGAIVSIYLPASNIEIAAIDYPRAVDTYGTGSVLVMDDEEMIRRVIGDLLECLGFHVEFAIDGDEALKFYREALENGRKFNAVIMDLTIPCGMGGKDAIRKLLEIDPNAVVVVSSGYCDDPIMAKFVEYGFKAALPKPFTLAQLKNSMQSIMSPSNILQ